VLNIRYQLDQLLRPRMGVVAILSCFSKDRHKDFFRATKSLAYL